MPIFGTNTPEALLGRSDSLNPATTCKGITSNGKLCRRSVAGAQDARNGVLAVSSIDGCASAAAAFYCWQHKDQADNLVDESAAPSEQTKLFPLKERNSIDTLVEKLGVLELDPEPEPQQESRPFRKRDPRRAERRQSAHHIARPPTWSSVQGPVIKVPVDALPMEQSSRPRHRPSMPRPQRKPKPQKQQGFFASLCCGSVDDDDYVEVVRHKQRRSNQQPEMAQMPSRRDDRRQESKQSRPTDQAQAITSRLEGRANHREDYSIRPSVYQDTPRVPQENRPAGPRPIKAQALESSTWENRRPLGDKTAHPLNAQAPQSATARLLSLIPSTLSPQTTSSLLAELSKPISATDEPGYIYIFWLTPESQATPSSRTTTSLLQPSSGNCQRRVGDVLASHPSVREANGKKTILLKIGRARNVHRRMNQWENQCGYTPSLLRFYPYVSTPAPSPAGTPNTTARRANLNPDTAEYLRRMSQTHASTSRASVSPQGGDSRSRRPSLSLQDSTAVRQVPNVKRVERLIHLELAEKRAKRECETCGRMHQEWFEVEATRDGVKGVDEVVRRWVGWSERYVEENV